MASRESYDTIIVGAGSAGCVLANRLTADAAHRVLLVEAGPPDKSPLIRMPKGFGALIADAKHAWQYPVEPHEGNGQRAEKWVRGKTLGGSSSINGMMYCRGQPEDYDHWQQDLGLEGWGWKDIGAAFRAIEDNALGDDGVRGVGGPVKLSPHPDRHPFSDALLRAAAAIGIPVRDDINRPDQEGIAYTTYTIRDGRRCSAAMAFLHPVTARPNLTVLTGTLARRVVFAGGRAVGVEVRPTAGGALRVLHATQEVILSAGAIESPCILQRSGVGPAALLAGLGIPLVRDAPGVGANLREQWLAWMTFKLKDTASYNQEFHGLPLLKHLLKYLFTKKGLMATGAQEIYGFLKSRPELKQPDVQIHAAPFSLQQTGDTSAPHFDGWPGAHLLVYPMKPTSQGRVEIRSADVGEPPRIVPNYLATEADRRTSIDALRLLRRLVAQQPLRGLILEEAFPGPQRQTDEQLLDAFRHYGQTTYHAVGTCKMGLAGDAMAVVDARLCVHGVQGLRVMDLSVFPTAVCGNTNGPAMATAWRGADIILADRQADRPAGSAGAAAAAAVNAAEAL
jgi:choline dehydrogenase-like flavoprotein